MKDIIWTVIAVWLVYRIVAAFQSMSSRSAKKDPHIEHPGRQPNARPDKNPLKEEGEYVDFEELN